MKIKIDLGTMWVFLLFWATPIGLFSAALLGVCFRVFCWAGGL